MSEETKEILESFRQPINKLYQFTDKQITEGLLALDYAIEIYGDQPIYNIPERIILADCSGNIIYKIRLDEGFPEIVTISPKQKYTKYLIASIIGSLSILVISYYFLKIKTN